MLHGAQMMWTASSLPEEQLGLAMDKVVFENPQAGLGKLLLEIGRLDEIMDSYIPNSSLHWWILFPSRRTGYKVFSVKKLH